MADGAVDSPMPDSGADKWRYDPPQGSHVLQLAYRADPSAVLAIEWPFEDGGHKQLLQFSTDDGQILDMKSIGEPTDTCFAQSGQLVVRTSGELIDTLTGAVDKVYE